MAVKICKELDEAVVSSGFLDSFDYVLTDCDGVLWLGDTAIPGSPETIQTLVKLGKKVIYVTNNSTKSRAEYLKKCERLGFPAELDNIISTSFCVAVHLKSLNFQKKVYVFGSPGIIQELDSAGIESLPIGPDPMLSSWAEYIQSVNFDPEVGAVVVGFDEHVSYPKILKAATYLKNPDCLFVATNRDEQFPTEGDLIIPGTGTFVSAIETASGRTAVSVGKPSKFMFDCIVKIFPEISNKRCLMIGDRLNTDILFGTSNGLQTLLVLTGVSSLDEVRTYQESDCSDEQSLVPDYYAPFLRDFGRVIKT